MGGVVVCLNGGPKSWLSLAQFLQGVENRGCFLLANKYARFLNFIKLRLVDCLWSLLGHVDHGTATLL